MEALLILKLFLPLAGFFVSFAGQSLRKDWGFWFYTPCFFVGLSLASYIASWLYFRPEFPIDFLWVNFDSIDLIKTGWGIYYDTLSAVMCGVVLTVSFCVHLYSIGYMASKHNRTYFMAYLSLFTFMMLFLVLAPNLLQMFLGWEGVGLCSYLLIGFFHYKPSATQAAQKAFVVNRVADIGFMLGLLAVWLNFNHLDWATIFYEAPVLAKKSLGFEALTFIGAAFIIAAMGKSAQFGFHVWLPDAMEGPTPASALIHAATMVTAGVFLIVRLSPLYELMPLLQNILLYAGLVTALFTGFVALVQSDIKRVIAYSTCSQIGFMMMACGCGAYTVAIFHLATHAFFKALLFLGAGAVIHALSDEQNMSKMGGLRTHIPQIHIIMWVGFLALMGVPFFAGYFSKDAVVAAVYYAEKPFAFWGILVCVCLTVAYSCRLMFLVFYGENRSDEHVRVHIHDISGFMRVALAPLIIGSIGLGWLCNNFFLYDENDVWWKDIAFKPFEKLHGLMHYAPFILLTLTFGFFAWLYILLSPEKRLMILNILFPHKLRSWLRTGMGVDKLYEFVFVRAQSVCSRVFGFVDHLWDQYIVNGASLGVYYVGACVRYLHTNLLYNAITWMMFAFIITLLWVYACQP